MAVTLMVTLPGFLAVIVMVAPVSPLKVAILLASTDFPFLFSAETTVHLKVASVIAEVAFKVEVPVPSS